MRKSVCSWLVAVSCAALALTTVFGQTPPAGQAQAAGQPPAAGAAQTQRGPTHVAPPRMAVREIQDDLFQIAWGLDSTCMYVLVTKDKALVVDTQTMTEFDGKKIIDYVRASPTSRPWSSTRIRIAITSRATRSSVRHLRPSRRSRR